MYMFKCLVNGVCKCGLAVVLTFWSTTGIYWNQFDRWHPPLYGYLDIPFNHFNDGWTLGWHTMWSERSERSEPSHARNSWSERSYLCLIIPVIPVHFHKASTTARSFMHTPLTVCACSYYPHKQANTNAAFIDFYWLSTPITTVTFSFYTLHLNVQFNHFNCTHWVAVRCEASGSYLYLFDCGITERTVSHK